jgi:hypothetical protein
MKGGLFSLFRNDFLATEKSRPRPSKAQIVGWVSPQGVTQHRCSVKHRMSGYATQPKVGALGDPLTRPFIIPSAALPGIKKESYLSPQTGFNLLGVRLQTSDVRPTPFTTTSTLLGGWR